MDLDAKSRERLAARLICRIAASLLVLSLAGCAGVQEGAARGAVEGLKCGPGFFICAPIGALVGGAIGGAADLAKKNESCQSETPASGQAAPDKPSEAQSQPTCKQDIGSGSATSDTTGVK